MDHFLDEGEEGLSGQELHDAFEQCLREGHLVPICFVSARTGAGVKELLDARRRSCCRIRRKAIRRRSSRARGANAQPIEAVPDPKKHVIADVFKIVNDPFVGKLSVFRVYQGTVKKDTQLLIDDGKKPFKVGHLFKLKGKDHIEIDQAIPGDIAARREDRGNPFRRRAARLARRGSDSSRSRSISRMPMFGLAVEPAHKGQEQKLAQSLHKLGEEDPCFRFEHNKELNESVDARTVRPAPEADARTHEGALRRRGEDAAAEDRLSRNGRRPRPKAITATRSRPAAPASSAKCSCASNRCRAAAASSSSTRSRAARFRASSFPRSKKACARCSNTAPSPATSCRTCA